MFKNRRRAQSIIEYTILLCVILAALMIMQFLIKRRYQGGIKEQVDQLGPQYSPGHTTSTSASTTTSSTTSYTGGGTANIWGADIPQGMTVSRTSSSSTFDKKEAVDSFITDND